MCDMPLKLLRRPAMRPLDGYATDPAQGRGVLVLPLPVRLLRPSINPDTGPGHAGGVETSQATLADLVNLLAVGSQSVAWCTAARCW
jgi:hypothetical protein